MGPGNVEVGLCQYELGSATSLDALLDRTESLFDRAGRADLYVLPELFVSDCLRTDGDAVATLGPDGRDRLHAFLADAAADRDAVVVGGSYNIVERGETYNRCPVAVPGRDVRTYDKANLIPEERRAGKRPGDGPLPVVEYGDVGFGVAVCYDVEFPAAVRSLAARGAEVVAVPSWTATEAGYQRVSRCAAARAVENQLYVAQVSVVGARSDGDLTGTGRSAVFAPCDDVVGPHGTRLSLPRDEGTAATCSVDVDALRTSREEAAVRPFADGSRSEADESGT
ncbi:MULTISPECIES: nitrilase-related carbon-nitrogen hydrolase [Halorussus]|uniref:nitrilase-related carbon-nitrogen hydrolase n=1 Tax=Halorussus TaxID=1070314 RepID=UPI00209D7021|nr:nitrilase-related carbon-nitrogen hydrolase [Halorussus vallis]USZ77618.1 hypothetical protein NGM07_09835 [Halorussus vallis]